MELQPGTFGVFNWFDFETTADRYRLPNLSRALPLKTEINIVQLNTAPAPGEKLMDPASERACRQALGRDSSRYDGCLSACADTGA